MIVNNDRSTSAITNLYTRQLPATENAQREQPSSASRQQADAGQDQVEISSEALTLHKSVEAAMGQEDVRWDKVDELRKRITQQTYQVPVQELVKRLLPDQTSG